MVVMEAKGLVVWGGDVQGSWVLVSGKIWGSIVSGILEEVECWVLFRKWRSWRVVLERFGSWIRGL